MSDAGWALQVAVKTALDAAPPIGATVYDDVPADAGWPHIEIGDLRAYDWSAAQLRGEDHVFEIHVWSRYAGRKEAHALMAAIKGRLHEMDLGLVGASLVLLRFLDDELFRDADGETRHGIVRFRAITTV